ncbi:hypothetical protein BGZ74_004187 [Mortierella antarctica]|nr:hypothetical protein BGZ74_004187 [Mortierella antarctica]
MNNGQVYLKRLRFLILPFSIVAGGLFAARWDIIVKDSKRYINYRKHNRAGGAVGRCSLYTSALWGKPLKFIHRNLRAVAVLAIAVCWLYATIGDLTDLIYVAFKVGPLDLKFRKHQFIAYGGYDTDANVIVVRPDEVNFQAPPPMQQQHQFMQQDAPTDVYVRPEPLQYQPSPAPPPVLHYSSPPLPGNVLQTMQ